MDLNTLVIFEKIAKTGGFSAAASELRISKASASQKIKQLEEDLGVRLFERSTRRVRLTHDGRLFEQNLAPLLENLREIQASARGAVSEPKGRIRMSSPFDVGLYLIRHVIPSFRTLYPEIQIEMDYSQRFVDFGSEDFDLAIRATRRRLADSDLIATPLSTTTLRLYRSRSFKNASIKAPKDLAGEHLLTLHGAVNSIRCKKNTCKLQPRSPLTVSDMLAVKEAVLSGLGIGLLPDFLVQEEFNLGLLEHVLPDWEGDQIQFYAIYPSRIFSPKRIKLFIDYLKDGFML